MAKIFEREVLPGFQDLDPANVVFFSRHFELVHRAFEAWMMDKGGVFWKKWFGCTENIAFPLRNVSSRYDHPISGGKPILVEAFLKEKSEHSLSFKFTLSVESKLCTEQEWTVVPVDMTNFEKSKVPDWVVNLFKTYI